MSTTDNAGLDATGRNQFGAIVAVDSPLGLYDQLIATVNNDANPGHTTRGSPSQSIAWNVPFGYGSLSIPSRPGPPGHAARIHRRS